MQIMGNMIRSLPNDAARKMARSWVRNKPGCSKHSRTPRTPKVLVKSTEAGEDADPDWSPDGTAIVWVRFTDASIGDVTVAAADGGLPTVLTPGAAPAWRPLIGQAEAP